MSHEEIHDTIRSLDGKLEKMRAYDQQAHTELSRDMKSMKKTIEENRERIDMVEEIVLPWSDQLKDVAAVGRVGRLIVKLSVYAAAIGGLYAFAREGIADMYHGVIEWMHRK